MLEMWNLPPKMCSLPPPKDLPPVGKAGLLPAPEAPTCTSLRESSHHGAEPLLLTAPLCATGGLRLPAAGVRTKGLLLKLVR